MRTFKRLLPVLLVLILLAGMAPALPASAIGTSPNSSACESQSQPISRFSRSPSTLRLDFGTVVRDTADDQSVGPGRWQAPSYVSPWNSVFTWSWFSLLIPR